MYNNLYQEKFVNYTSIFKILSKSTIYSNSIKFSALTN